MKALLALCFWPIVSALVLLNGCKRGQEPVPAPAPTTLATLYATALNDSLKNRDIGYGFVIYENATMVASGSGGFKSRVVDREGQQPYTIDTKMHIASMSKTIVAMAFAQMMAQKGIRTTDRIAPYLPPAWSKGPNIDQITFRDLLTHRSGITGFGDNCQNGAYSENTYAGLQRLIAKGVTSANKGQYCYQNANFGLFRILIPALTGYVFTGNQQTDDQQTQQQYLAYAQENIFGKVGLTGIVPTYPAGSPTYTYDAPYSGGMGWNPGSFFPVLGAYGWYLSPHEAGKLYATVLSSDSQTVLTTPYKDSLLTNNLGVFRLSTNLGSVAYHDGWWYRDDNKPYQGLRTIWMKLPDNLTVVLFTNALDSKTKLFPSTDGADIVAFAFRAYGKAKQLKGGRLGPVTVHIEHPEPH